MSIESRPLRILQFSDLHLFSDPQSRLMGVNTEESFHQVMRLAQAQAWPADLILLTGDLAQEPELATYQRLYHYLEHLDIPCVCLPGNHDEGNWMHQALNHGSVRTVFQAWQTDWLILCLDSRVPNSAGGALNPAELTRLDTHLTQYPDRPTALALHHHPCPVNSRWMDTMTVENSDALFDLLARHPQVQLLLCGHVHQALSLKHSHVTVLTCPSTCFQFKPYSADFRLDEQAAGFRWLQLHPQGHFDTGIHRLATLPEGLQLSSSNY